MIADTLKAAFPSCYFPTVEYLMLLHRFQEVTIDLYESYAKQTLRNRCFILSPNGVQTLTVPVIFHSTAKPSVKTIAVSYAECWQKIHLGAIRAAYGRSAWFEFIYDDLEKILSMKFQYLHELNHALLLFVLQKIKSPVHLTLLTPDDFQSMTGIANVKTTSPVSIKEFKPYSQVFQDRFGFTENLSCIDLLFNTGNRSMDYLR
jgi:hypothetical protein